jgi:hypothetical protein
MLPGMQDQFFYFFLVIILYRPAQGSGFDNLWPRPDNR